MQNLMNARVVDGTPVTEDRFSELLKENRAMQEELHASLNALADRLFDLEQLHGHYGAQFDPETQMVRADYEALNAQLVAVTFRYHTLGRRTAN